MGLQELRADTKLARERIAKLESSKIDLKEELTENVYPLLDGIMEAVMEDFTEVWQELAAHAAEIDEAADQAGDNLHPETTQQIVGLLEVGKLLANELEQAMPKLDDLAKKRVRQLVKSYRQGAIIVSEMLAEITFDPDDDEVEAPPDIIGTDETRDDLGDDEEDLAEEDIDEAADGGEG